MGVLQGSVLSHFIYAKHKKGWFLGSKFHMFSLQKWQFLFKITKVWVFLSKQAIFCEKMIKTEDFSLLVKFLSFKQTPCTIRKCLSNYGLWIFHAFLHILAVKKFAILHHIDFIGLMESTWKCILWRYNLFKKFNNYSRSLLYSSRRQ